MASTESDDDDEAHGIYTNNEVAAMENGGHQGNPYGMFPPGVPEPQFATLSNLETGEDDNTHMFIIHNEVTANETRELGVRTNTMATV